MASRLYAIFVFLSFAGYVPNTQSQGQNGNFIGTPWWFSLTTQPFRQQQPQFTTRWPTTRPPVVHNFQPFRVETTPPTTTTERTTTTTTEKPEVDSSELISEKCFAQPKCPPQDAIKYALLEGICNNPIDKNRGRKDRPLKRLLPPQYGDGTGSPKLAKDGQALPSARKISRELNLEPQQTSFQISHMMPWWGQFMTHEFTHTPKGERENGAALNCNCKRPDEECHNIPVEDGDPYAKRYELTCVKMERSEVVPNVDCDSDIREQKNKISAFIDASSIYGDSEAEMKKFLKRHTQIGELQTGNYVEEGFDDSLASQSQVHRDFAARMRCPTLLHKPPDKPCLMAGDTRANENPGLTALNVLFVRLHNRIVKELSRLNPQWDRDTLVKETKSIIAAVLQLITYREFLPLLLGEKLMERFSLSILEKGHWYGYDPAVDATINNAFATAAFRYGHTNIAKQMTRPAPDWFTEEGENMPIKDIFFNNEPLLESFTGGANSVLRGLAKDAAVKTDAKMTHDMRELLFEDKIEPGQDLFSVNMQRGRDHGLPSYNDYRELCGLEKASSFNELTEIPANTRNRLSTLYSHVDDIDLYTGGLAETAVDEGVVGPTFACIIGYQFRDLRAGDRFWFENGGRHKKFTARQLNSIRQYSLAGVMCETMSDLRSIQPKPMLQNSVPGNQRQYCRNMPTLDLTPWWEEQSRKDEEEDGFEWSPWIPCVTSDGAVTSVTTAVNDALLYRPGDVCHDIHDSETRTVNSIKQVRVKCKRGTIRGTYYPHIDSAYEVVWTSWSDRSSPDGSGDDDEARTAEESCRRPIAIQVQTVNGVPARETGDVFESFGIIDGFVCRGAHQFSRRCQDYRVRYLCRKSKSESLGGSSAPSARARPANKEPETDPNKLIWTPWISNDTPASGGDKELTSDVADQPEFCKRPLYIEGRTVGGHIDARRAGDVLDEFSQTVGLICDNSKQTLKNCNDYEVRYLCRAIDMNKKDTGVPPAVGKQAKDFCRSFGICC